MANMLCPFLSHYLMKQVLLSQFRDGSTKVQRGGFTQQVSDKAEMCLSPNAVF